jgi:aldose 1-epimerase
MPFTLHGGRRLLVSLSVGALLVAAMLLGVGGSANARSSRAVHKSVHGSRGLSITSRAWGTADGQPVTLFTLKNGHRMTVEISNYGGVVQSIWVPDRSGHVRNVALGFPSLSDYVNDFEHQPWPAAGGSGDTYFGAIIGRYANRIANGEFTLNSTTYHLPQNNGPNTLHGGPNAYNTKVWQATPESTAHGVALKLTYTDPDNYNGFPGAVTNEVTYTLTRDSALHIAYKATTTKPTVINLTNHTYFNLAGEGSGDVFGQLLKINASHYTPIDSNLIPTGAFDPVAGTPFDFRSLKPIGRDIHDGNQQLILAHGYDHNWVLNGSGMKLAAVAEDPVSGRTLSTYTTEPGVQFYSGNFLVGDLVGPSGHTYRQTDGFTLETQHYPDTPHHIGDPNWPSVVLNPGQTFTSATIYKFGTAGRGHGRVRHRH